MLDFTLISWATYDGHEILTKQYLLQGDSPLYLSTYKIPMIKLRLSLYLIQ